MKIEELTVCGGGGSYSMLVVVDRHPILLNLQAGVDYCGEILIFW